MLGARIAALRRRAGLSQNELAQRLRISASAIGMYEQGRREPAVQTLVELAEIFGVSTDYLLTGKPGPDSEELVRKTVLESLAAAEQRLQSRKESPFSQQELAVLFAAMLLEP